MTLSSILIIDDNEADQFLNKVFIEKLNPDIEIYQAWDGAEGLEMLDNKTVKPDAIFLDIYMPRMNGEEFIKEYLAKNYNYPVFVMTTSKGEEDRFNFQDSIIGYETKPITDEVLQRVLKKLENKQ